MLIQRLCVKYSTTTFNLIHYVLNSVIAGNQSLQDSIKILNLKLHLYPRAATWGERYNISISPYILINPNQRRKVSFYEKNPIYSLSLHFFFLSTRHLIHKLFVLFLCIPRYRCCHPLWFSILVFHSRIYETKEEFMIYFSRDGFLKKNAAFFRHFFRHWLIERRQYHYTEYTT